MKIDSRFLQRPKSAADITMILDGVPITAQSGDTVAAALLAHSGAAFRSSATQDFRAPFCMMGVCFECLLEIDGKENSQACMVLAKDGMVIKRQNGLRELSGAPNG